MSVYVEQDGYTTSFQVIVNGDPDTPRPKSLKYKKPNFRGLTVSGIPKYQGPAGLVLTYDTQTIGDFQFWAVAFFPALNSGSGPEVTVYWPNPYEAGRFVTADGILLWPEFDEWRLGLLQTTTMEITRLVQREG